jgi:hypothetical protein
MCSNPNLQSKQLMWAKERVRLCWLTGEKKGAACRGRT